MRACYRCAPAHLIIPTLAHLTPLLSSPPQAYTLAQHVCFEQSWLLYGRHLDQVLLCCLYSICKVGGAWADCAVCCSCTPCGGWCRKLQM